MGTRTNSHTHASTYACTYAHKNGQAHTYTHVHTCTHKRTYTHTHTHTCTRVQVRARARVQASTHVPSRPAAISQVLPSACMPVLAAPVQLAPCAPGAARACVPACPPVPMPPSLLLLQVGHTDYVSTLAYAPPGLSQDYPAGALVSGEWGWGPKPRGWG